MRKTTISAADHLQHLVETDEMYCGYNQNERSDDRLMEHLGHPYAKAYRKLRDFFDGLRYCCNSSARRFSYASGNENSEYWAPDLAVSWYPKGLYGFWHVYPAHEDWKKYLRAAADAKWPKGVEPDLFGGTWYINTLQGELAEALVNLAAKHEASFERDGQPSDSGAGWRIHIRLMGRKSVTLHAGIVRLLRKYHKGSILPARTADAPGPETEVPLGEKAFVPGNVKSLTITPREILYPLIPLSGGGSHLVARTATSIEDLLRQGYPFKNVELWLGQFVVPKCVNQLRRKYAKDLGANVALK